MGQATIKGHICTTVGHSCNHYRIKFCPCCGKVYCEDCGQTWSKDWTYTWVYQNYPWSYQYGGCWSNTGMDNKGNYTQEVPETKTCKHGKEK